MTRKNAIFAVVVSIATMTGHSQEAPGQARDFKTYNTKSPVVTNAWQAVQSKVNETLSPVAAKVFNVSAYDGDNVTFIDKNGDEKRDYRVVIGAGTVSDGNDGTHGQSIVIGRDAKSHGCASCALGPNSETGDNGYDIAIGWRSVAVSQGAIAIGCGTKSGQDYWLDPERTQHNPNEQATAAVGLNAISIGRGTRAENDNSIAVGAGAKANASGAVQLGAGDNAEANTLKFQDVTIVKDGKVVGAFDSKELDPVVYEVQSDSVVTAKTHSITTIECTSPSYSEIEVYPSSSRNYEIFIDNTLTNRMNLPLWLSDDGAKLFMKDGDLGPFLKLPLAIKIKEPKPGRCLVDVEQFDDGYAWNPTITNVKYTVSSGSTWSINVEQMQGTEIHLLTNCALKLAYGDDVVQKKITQSNALYSYSSFSNASFTTNQAPDSAAIECSGEGFTRTYLLSF